MTKYQNIKLYIFDFMVISKEILSLGIKFLHFERKFDEDSIKSLFDSSYPGLSVQAEFISYLENIYTANYDKLIVLEEKRINSFDCNGLKSFRINLQQTISHHNSASIDNEYNTHINLLLELTNYSNKQDKPMPNLLELSEKNLDEVIVRLKEVYSKIKN